MTTFIYAYQDKDYQDKGDFSCIEYFLLARAAEYVPVTNFRTHRIIVGNYVRGESNTVRVRNQNVKHLFVISV